MHHGVQTLCRVSCLAFRLHQQQYPTILRRAGHTPEELARLRKLTMRELRPYTVYGAKPKLRNIQ